MVTDAHLSVALIQKPLSIGIAIVCAAAGTLHAIAASAKNHLRIDTPPPLTVTSWWRN
ncbi:hypothetical protein SC1_01306 [Sphingopyxis sp. C-1]|nr:hypothetical protein SC1_01306 [Sphingopyxis sp. C-1]